MNNMLRGLVIRSTGSWYTIEQEDGSRIQCKARGIFRLSDKGITNPVVAGDRVFYEMTDKETGLITGIGKRDNYIIRKASNLSRQSHILAANIDHAFLVVTLQLPRTSTGFIDRFLVTAEAYGIPASILFNKSDIYDKASLVIFEEWKRIYAPLGYSCYLVSAFNTTDIKEISGLFKKGVYLFAGHSGVGKTSLVNALDPSLNLKTSGVSEAHGKGRHTTTFAEMIKLGPGKYIVDTPGIREFGMYDFSPAEVSHYFPEMRELLNKCRFDNCMHIEEPGCSVKNALEKGKISLSRYGGYISIIEDKDSFR